MIPIISCIGNFCYLFDVLSGKDGYMYAELNKNTADLMRLHF